MKDATSPSSGNIRLKNLLCRDKNESKGNIIAIDEGKKKEEFSSDTRFFPFYFPYTSKKIIFGKARNKKKSWRLTGSKPIRTLQQSGCCLGGVSALFDCLLLFSSALPSLREYHVKMKGKPQNNKDVPSTEKEKRESVCIVSIIDLS